jgi:phosphoserine phosphatase
VAEITESAMRGELDFKESFRRRMRLLKGMPETVRLNKLYKYIDM